MNENTEQVVAASGCTLPPMYEKSVVATKGLACAGPESVSLGKGIGLFAAGILMQFAPLLLIGIDSAVDHFGLMMLVAVAACFAQIGFALKHLVLSNLTAGNYAKVEKLVGGLLAPVAGTEPEQAPMDAAHAACLYGAHRFAFPSPGDNLPAMPTVHPSTAWKRPTARRSATLGFLLGLLWATSLSGQPQPAAFGPAQPDVLIVNSYAPGYEWSDDELTGLVGKIEERYTEFEPVIQYLDSKRFPDPTREPALLDDLLSKCRERPPKLIVTLDNFAFEFVLRHRAELGPDIPLVFGGLNRFTPDMIAGQRSITGVSEESDFGGTFDLIQRLLPKTRRILAIGNRSESSAEKRRSLQTIIRSTGLAERYNFEFFENWSNAELLQRVSSLPTGTVGLILDVTVDSTGHYNYRDGAFSQALASRSSVPLFITARPPGKNDWSKFSWDGIGGGLVVAEMHGATVGEIVLRVLAGEPADSIPVVAHSPQRLEVDYRQMQRFGLDLAALPPGTHVLNAPVTFYQINRSRIILAAEVVVFLCGVIVVLLVNIVRRRRAELALRRTEEQLRSAQKLEAVGLLASGVAHDFNNILQVIRSHTGFLQESLSDNPQTHEDTEVILAATERAAQLTRQLLLFSRKQTLNPVHLDANLLVADMAKMLRRVLGEHIELKVAPLPEPAPLLADKGQLEQVLLNLCLNARDAMPGGGRIQISLEKTTITAAHSEKKPQLKPGPHLVLKVSDTGCGMPREVLDRLFEPFFTTKEHGRGTGLGLSVVYGIVHRHGGTIGVYSEVGAGSVFSILLPLSHPEGAVPPTQAETPIPRGQGTILLAEDDPSVSNIAIRILRQNGFSVLSAADGEQAEALLAAHHRDIRLAVLDVLMPKRSGRQIHDFIKATYPAIPVLFCSGYTADMLPPGTAPAPGFAILSKPYSSHDLLAAVHRSLAAT